MAVMLVTFTNLLALLNQIKGIRLYLLHCLWEIWESSALSNKRFFVTLLLKILGILEITLTSGIDSTSGRMMKLYIRKGS